MKNGPSIWLIALLAVVLHLGTCAGIIYLRWEAILHPEIARKSKIELPRQMWSFRSDVVDQLIAELKAERERLTAREKDLAATSARVQAERAELDGVRSGIEAMKLELEQTITEVKAGEAGNLRSLAKTYSALSPTATVAIFGELDDQTVVKILSLMRADKVAPILEAMTRSQVEGESLAKRAAHLSDMLRLLRTKKEEAQS